MDVNVDADGRNPESDTKYQIGRFKPDAREGQQGFFVRRYIPLVIIDKYAGNPNQIRGFRAVESRGIDDFRHLLFSQRQQGLRAGSGGEQFIGRLKGDGVFGSQGYDS